MVVSVYRRGRMFWASYREGGERFRVSLETTHRKVAEQKRIEVEFELLRRQREREMVVPGVDDRVGATIAEVRDAYDVWSRANKRPKTVRNDVARLQSFLEAHESEAPIDSVRTRDVEGFLSRRALAGAAPATVLRHREILHALFEYAVRLEFVDQNPVSNVPRPRLPERDPRFLSLDQIDELLGTVAGDLVAPLVATAVFAGLRREELVWLTWADLDLGAEVPVLRVRSKSVAGESWTPKTKKNRVIPISKRLRSILQAIPRKGRWLFPSPEGLRWDPDNLGWRMRGLLRRLGLSWNFLDMRHTFGSQLARNGVSLLKISKLMGNSPEIARRHYINLVPEELCADVEF